MNTWYVGIKGVIWCFLKDRYFVVFGVTEYVTCFNVQKAHYFSNTEHYCSSSMTRLSQTLRCLQSPSFRQAQSALIGQLQKYQIVIAMSELPPLLGSRNGRALLFTASTWHGCFNITEVTKTTPYATFPHHDIDMWGRVWMSHFRGACRILTW